MGDLLRDAYQRERDAVMAELGGLAQSEDQSMVLEQITVKRRFILRKRRG